MTEAPKALEEIRAYFARVKAMAEEGIAKCDAIAPAAPARVEVAPQFMKIHAYARHRDVSRSTVYRWIKLGLPVDRRGAVVRVRVADADAWDEASAIARSAEIAAGGTET